MRRGRIFIYLAFILILGLVAVVFIWQRFLVPTSAASSEAIATPVIDMVDVIVIAQRVPRGTALSDPVLGMVPIQRDLFIEGMFTNLNDVKGRLARFDLDAGIPLTKGMLVESAEQLSTTGSVAALSIPRGMVSVSIPIDRLSSVSYAPQAGDHVNVIVTMLMADYDADFQTMLPNQTGLVLGPGPTNPETGPSALVPYFRDGAQGSLGKGAIDTVLGQTFYVSPSEPQRPRLVSQSLLQDAMILHVGTFPVKQDGEVQNEQNQVQEPPTEGVSTPQPEENDQVQPENNAEATPQAPVKGPDIISLIVSPQDAITLNYLIYSGAQLTLALRSAGDDTRVSTEAVTLQFLLDQYNIPVPAKLPYGIPNRPTDDRLGAPSLTNDSTPTPEP